MKHCLLLSLVFMSVNTWGNSVNPGQVSNIITGGSVVYFKVTGATYLPCATYARYVLNTDTVFGKNSYALLLMAYASGTPIGVITANGCNTSNNDAEDVNDIYTP